MTNRTKQKVLATAILYLLWIVLGTFGILPSFFYDTYIGQTHSIFRPFGALLEIALYVFLTYVLVTVIFGAMDRISEKNN